MDSMAEEKYDFQIIGSMPVGIIIVDENVMVKYVNRFFSDTFKLDKKECTNSGPGDCICCINSFSAEEGCGHSPNCDSCELRKLVEHTISSRKPSEPVELQFDVLTGKRPDSRWFKINTVPIEKDEEKRVLLTITDITEYKKTHMHLLRLKEAAEAANKAKSSFLANMSHEIRTPLNGIIGMTDLTFSTSLTDEQKENLQIVKNCADTLLSLINDILDLSKIEANKVIIEEIEFDIDKMMQKIINTHLTKARDKSVELKYIIEDTVPKILLGDSHRLGQVLNNLVSNAVKFTDKGYVAVHVNLIKSNNDIFEIQFAVEDTGIGINHDELKYLFKNFSQVDGTITRKYGGTGLGLVISQKLAELMGGKIKVISEKGHGSRFFFSVKLQEAKNIVEETHAKLNKNQKSDNLSVLLVEDNHVSQLVIKLMLKELGYREVTVASNGVEALKFCEEKDFDIILMDVQMPELDGVETVKIIREKEKKSGRHIPIIVITAYALKGDRENFLSQGMDEYISKPVNIHELNETLIRVSSSIYKDEDIIELYLKNNDETNTDDCKEFSKEDLEYFLTQINEISSYIKAEEKNSNRYYHLERLAHAIIAHAEESDMKLIKKYAFKMEMAARKKDDSAIVNNYDKICNILKCQIVQ